MCPSVIDDNELDFVLDSDDFNVCKVKKFEEFNKFSI